MTTNKTPDVREPGRATVRLVFVGVAANALTQFALQAWMSYRFARDVWAIPQALCVGVICALDLFAVVFMAFTYLLRTAKWHTQIYVWIVFTAGIGAQLFAAELYGAKEQWATPVRAFAALPALFLAASLHGLIIWRNHGSTQAAEGPMAPEPESWPVAPHVLDLVEGEIGIGPCTYQAWNSAEACIYAGASADLRTRLCTHQSDRADWLEWTTKVTQRMHETMNDALTAERAIIQSERPQFNRQHNPDVRKLRTEGPLPVKAYGGREKELRANRKPGPRAATKRGRSGHPGREAAVARVLAGEDTASVAIAIGVSRRAVQIWVQDAATSTPVATEPLVTPELTAGVFTQSDPQPINGYSLPGAAMEAQAN